MKIKKKKTISYIIIILLCTFLNSVKAETVPSKFNVTSSSQGISTTTYLPENFPGGVFIHKKQADNSKYVYCIEIHDLSGNDTYNKSGELDKKYAYVLQNGYPNKALFGNEDKDYFTTALAIWYLSNPNDSVFSKFNLSDGTYNGAYSDIVTKLKDLINAANSYNPVTPAISFPSNLNKKLSPSSDENYYVSDQITPQTAGIIENSSYSVSLKNAPSGTFITSASGTNKSTFKTNEGFIVKVPKSSVVGSSISFDVKVSANGKIYKAYKYSPSNSAYQSVAALYSDINPIEVTTTLNLDAPVELKISKQDGTTSKELPGATLVLKNKDGGVVETWVSTDKPHVIKNLAPGKYYLTETIAPEGFDKSTETVEIVIKEDGTVPDKVVMKNYPKNRLIITKEDGTTSKELPGATLVLKDKDGNVIETWVSEDKPHTIEGIAPGKYYLTETIAPEGYRLNTETIEIVVKANGSVTKQTMKNYPNNLIVISKRDATTGEELPGATLILKNKDGKEIAKWISSTEAHVIENLAPGKYYLTEKQAPEGYELSTETIEFIVKEDGTVDDVIIMENDRIVKEIPTGDSKIFITLALLVFSIGIAFYFYVNKKYISKK